VALPLVIGAVALGAAWLSARRESGLDTTVVLEPGPEPEEQPPTEDNQPENPMPNENSNPEVDGAWSWPVPSVGGHQPVASQEFRPPSHKGVDIMFRINGSWVANVGIPICAARDGKVWSTGITGRGHNIVLDHGPPWATFYQHLCGVLVEKGDTVTAGQLIGFMGADPSDPEGLVHLHFECWYNGAGGHEVDPAPILAQAIRPSGLGGAL
jgi:murein DD-endopeptidase MepM/ murein hydrolase activator NlpD